MRCVKFGLELAFRSIDALFVCSRLVVRMDLHFGRSAASPIPGVYVESIHGLLASVAVAELRAACASLASSKLTAEDDLGNSYILHPPEVVSRRGNFSC